MHLKNIVCNLSPLFSMQSNKLKANSPPRAKNQEEKMTVVVFIGG
jgi:hypothetical protein